MPYFRSSLVRHQPDLAGSGFANLLATLAQAPVALREADQLRQEKEEARAREIEQQDAAMAREAARAGVDVSWFQGRNAPAFQAISAEVKRRQQKQDGIADQDRARKRFADNLDIANATGVSGMGEDAPPVPGGVGPVEMVPDAQAPDLNKLIEYGDGAWGKALREAGKRSRQNHELGLREKGARAAEAEAKASKAAGTAGTHDKPTAADLRAVRDLIESQALANGIAILDEFTGKVIIDDPQAYQELQTAAYDAYNIRIPETKTKGFNKEARKKAQDAIKVFMQGDGSWFGSNGKGDKSRLEAFDPELLERAAQDMGMKWPFGGGEATAAASVAPVAAASSAPAFQGSPAPAPTPAAAAVNRSVLPSASDGWRYLMPPGMINQGAAKPKTAPVETKEQKFISLGGWNPAPDDSSGITVKDLTSDDAVVRSAAIAKLPTAHEKLKTIKALKAMGFK